MRNAQGGKIVKGNWLLWIIREEVLKQMGGRLLCRVAEIVEPIIEGDNRPPSLVLTFSIPLDTRQLARGQEASLQDFYGLTNPGEEQALENFLKN